MVETKRDHVMKKCNQPLSKPISTPGPMWQLIKIGFIQNN